MTPTVTVLQGDCLEKLRTLPDESVHCCVTSPPYWGLRDYGCEGQIGLEATPELYTAKMVEVFAEVWRVLRSDGTCWVNLGDSYSRAPEKGGSGPGNKGNSGNGLDEARRILSQKKCNGGGLKPKDLCGIPWRVAFALQQDGWYLRQDIIWHKPNPMPESVTDRCTKAHEYIFLLTKSERYHYDAAAIKEQSVADHPAGNKNHKGATAYANGSEEHRTKVGLVAFAQRSGRGGKNAFRGQGHFRDTETGPANREGRDMKDIGNGDTRNKRSVWTVATAPYSEAHFATFPPDLIKPCILAGCPLGGTVLDPFGGSGTTGMVASDLGRNAILIELNPAYVSLIKQRTNVTPGLGI